MTRDDDWVQLAMVNDAAVVELLIQIHQAPPPPRRIKSTKPEPLPLDWSVRQPRSKPLAVNNNNNKKSRSSPTTPLSWSGATSFSGGGSADGIEELSSRPQAPPPPPPPLDASRSKVSVGTRTRLSSKSKRPRKKKSIDELREEENLLNKERRHLKNELAALRIDIEKQRGINENLKRLKLAVETATTTTISTSFSQNICAGSRKMSNSIPFLPDLNIACGDPENL